MNLTKRGGQCQEGGIMNDAGPTRSSLWLVGCFAVALMRPELLLADGGTDPGPGRWVRVTTGTEVTGDGFVMNATETQGRSLSHDKRTTTFDVNGHAVRVPKPGTTVEGEVQTSDEKLLVLTRTGESLPIIVPRAAISSLDMRQRKSSKGKGLLFGALGGGVIGYAIGAATSGPGCQGGETGFAHLCTLDDVNKPAGALLGVVVGVILGVIVAPGAKWERVSLGHAQLSLRPTLRRGIGLSLSVGF
jgi:hypothetical protein